MGTEAKNRYLESAKKQMEEEEQEEDEVEDEDNENMDFYDEPVY